MFEALLDTVEEAAHGDQAVLWVLDDVHWADDATWPFVGYAARRVAEMSLVLAVTYWEEEIRRASARWASLVQLKRDPHVLAVGLRRLSTPDAERLARAVAPDLAGEKVAKVVERGAGTPLLIEELAGLAARPGQFSPLPDVVRVTVRERAGRLGPAGRDLLEVAAVAGVSVDARLLRALRPEAAPEGHVDFVITRPSGWCPARFQTKPPACYRAWQLPGPDFHRQATTRLRTARSAATSQRHLLLCWAHGTTSMSISALSCAPSPAPSLAARVLAARLRP